MSAADARLEGVRSAEGVIRCCPVCGDPWESDRLCAHADMTYGEALATTVDMIARMWPLVRQAFVALEAAESTLRATEDGE